MHTAREIGSKVLIAGAGAAAPLDALKVGLDSGSKKNLKLLNPFSREKKFFLPLLAVE